MRRRSGFTLIELMVVIVVVGMLAALLLPALGAARRRAKEAVARIEISQLEAGIASFKAYFGVEPPSGIVLCEKASDWPSYVPAMGTIRGLWPQFDFTTDIDINRNGTIDTPVVLEGPECLVFFLGGTLSANRKPEGFNKSATSPFSIGSNRTGRFFEFDSFRLQDRIGPNGYLEYRDQLGDASADPIVYYSSYDGTGYQNFDFAVVNGVTFSPYLQVPQGSNIPWKPQTFQIVCPGWDGLLGCGGLYDPNGANGPVSSLQVGRPTLPADQNFNGKAELDNMTNFVRGKLSDGN